MRTKLWKVKDDHPQPLEPGKLDFEKRLEDWLCNDVSLLSDQFLIIGRQIPIQSSGTIDLLAVDENANLVVVELKRAKAARDVVAQALDYASSIQEFGREELENTARSFLKKEFEDAFRTRFPIEVPDTVNERQRIYIVASSFDTATTRMVEYLSRTYGVDINCVSFSYFKTNDGEFVLRSALLSEVDVERRAKAADAKKRKISSEAELRDIAENVGVVDLWDTAIDGFSSFGNWRSQSTLYFFTRDDQGQRTFLTIFPSESSREKGLAVGVVFEHFSSDLNIEESKVRQVCRVSSGRAFPRSYYTTKDNSFYLGKEDLCALIRLTKSST